MSLILQTQRLNLREFTPADAAFIIQLLNSPGWLQYIGDKNIKTAVDAGNYLLNGPLKSYQQHGYGLWLVELKRDKAPIGMCGLINREALEDVDIGFAFLPEYTGQGYAYEAAKATLTYGQNTLNIPRIVAITLPSNHNSITLLQKIGLIFEKQINLPHDEEELLLYATPGVA